MKLPHVVVLAALTAVARAQDGKAVENLITENVIAAHVRFLADDLLEGRGPGTRGDALARLYLATQMQGCGLHPGVGESWNQLVPIVGITSTVVKTLTAKGSAGAATFQAPEQFTSVAGNGDANTAWNDAELVFVGYGITAPEQQWDDFGSTDVKGKVLLVMNNDPSEDPNRFAGKTRLYYGRWSYKYEEAARRGALGAIVIHTIPSAGYPWQVLQSNHGRENFWLPFRPEQQSIGIRSWCTEETAKKLCSLGGHDLDALRAAAEQGNQPPVALGVKVSLAITNTVKQIESGNVLGVLPGSDPKLKDDFVVVTAHFDHLGIGKPRSDAKPDTIYNGAVDNASGCAGMLALARACGALATAPRRSILFLAVTAEESGLLGSQFFCENPTVPREHLVANFNVDGLAVWGRTNDVEFIGYGKNSLGTLAAEIAKARGRRIEPDSNPDLGLFYRSDHFNFARIGVPAAYFKAGNDFVDQPENRRRMKNSYTTVHYHQPSDELAAWWKLDGAVADLQLLLECLLRTANDDAPPRWTPGDEFEKLR